MIRLFPWWLFLIVALIFGSLTIIYVQDYVETAGNLQAAIDNPPETIILGNLEDATFSSPIREFAVRDFGGASVGIVDTGRSGRSFLVVESATSPTVFLAFTDTTYAEGEFLQVQEAIEADWDNYVVRGVLTNSSLYRDDLIQLLTDEGIPVNASSFLIADLLQGDREEALRDWSRGMLVISIITAVLAVITGVVAFVKFRRWRKRRETKRAARRAAESVSVDAYADSPIQSSRRK